LEPQSRAVASIALPLTPDALAGDAAISIPTATIAPTHETPGDVRNTFIANYSPRMPD
jgi:hypothetical protein